MWGMDWIEMAQDRDRWWAIVNTVMNLRVPQNSGNFLTSWEPVSFSRRILLHGVRVAVIFLQPSMQPTHRQIVHPTPRCSAASKQVLSKAPSISRKASSKVCVTTNIFWNYQCELPIWKRRLAGLPVSVDASSDRKTGPEICIKCNLELFA